MFDEVYVLQYKQALHLLSMPQICEKSSDDAQRWHRSFTFSHDFGVFGKPNHILVAHQITCIFITLSLGPEPETQSEMMMMMRTENETVKWCNVKMRSI